MQQLKRVWANASKTQQLAAILFSLASIFCIFLLGAGRKQNEYTNLCAEIDDRASVLAIADDLEKASITYRIGPDGRTIEVKKSDFSQALRLLVQARPSGSRDSDSALSSIFAGSIGMTPGNRRDAEVRRREADLTKTISAFNNVRRARVLITAADNRLFSRKRKEARASVFLEVSRGKALSRCQVQAIRDLVSAAVRCLRHDNITIADSGGTDYAGFLQSEASKEKKKNVLKTQGKVEALLAQKIQNHLAVMFGRKNVNVAVSARMNLAQLQPKKSRYRKKRSSAKLVSLSSSAFVSSSTKKSKLQNPVFNAVSSLCVAVFVNSSLFPDGEIPAQLRGAIDKSIRTVARINDSRGDRVSIQSVPFSKASSNMPKEMKPPLCTASSTEHFPMSSWSVGGPVLLLLAVLLSIVIVRRKSLTEKMVADANALSGVFNINAQGDEAEQFTWDAESSDEDLVRDTAKRDPEVIANLIRTIRQEQNDEW